MSDSSSPGVPDNPAPASSGPSLAAAPPKLDPVDVFFALGSEVRLPIIKLLADGKRLSISAIAAELGRDLDGVGKQLLVLRDAGLVAASAGQDRRQTVYQIPASLRPAPGVLEVGFARIELARL